MKGWIGVDLDGTLAEYHGWQDDGGIGPPVPAMLKRVTKWLSEGKEVRILTARVSPVGHHEDDVRHQFRVIKEWCLEHVGMVLPITCSKDFAMVELWDDRAVQVIPNTGQRVDALICLR